MDNSRYLSSPTRQMPFRLKSHFSWYVLTAMHLDSQETSPSSQASRQARVEAWAASVVAAVGATEEVPVVSWALANMARAPATMMLVKRILSDLERINGCD